jgi:hypothetical protein
MENASISRSPGKSIFSIRFKSGKSPEGYPRPRAGSRNKRLKTTSSFRGGIDIPLFAIKRINHGKCITGPYFGIRNIRF